MSIIKRLFGSKDRQAVIPDPHKTTADKQAYAVYPRIRNADWKNLETVYYQPLGGDLVLTFVQDIDGRMEYITKEEAALLEPVIHNWKNNITAVPFSLFSTDDWDGKVLFNEPGDFSNEKIFDPAFLQNACEQLKTDKLVISISRRYRTMLTSFHETFALLERFFYSHFTTWRDTELGGDAITEYVLLANTVLVTHIVPLGFRMNLYKKDGQKLLSYSTMDEIGDTIDFQKIMECRSQVFSIIE